MRSIARLTILLLSLLALAGNAIYAVGGWDGATEEFVNEVRSYQVAFQTFLPVSIR